MRAQRLVKSASHSDQLVIRHASDITADLKNDYILRVKKTLSVKSLNMSVF